jgi:trans-2,3-dihydro-3-hydroxyanthranilate isomerase
MQAVATRLGFSETVFIDESASVPWVRIFTPATELPFAGHPLVGSAWVLGPQVTRLRCGIGEVTTHRDGDVTWVDVPMYGSTTDASGVAALLTRAGLPAPVAVSCVELPLAYVIAELGDAAHVAAARPSLEVLAEVFGTLIYARQGDLVRARFFAPGSGVDEDPATGSAAVALAVALSAFGEVEGRLTIHQGDEIGHPSRIELRWNGAVASIGGTVARDEVRNLVV